MSGATYRIDVQPSGGVYYQYKADVYRLSDDAFIARELGHTPDEAVASARLVVERMNQPATFEAALYVGDDGQDAEAPRPKFANLPKPEDGYQGHSVKV